MAIEIIIRFLLLHKKMTLAQAVEYLATQEAGLTVLVTLVPLLEKSWQSFSTANAALTAAYKRAAASPLTPQLVSDDGGRDNEFLFMHNCVNNVLHHSTLAEEVAAARVLELEMNNHAGLPSMDYEGETASADDLIDKLKEPTMLAAINRLGLAPHVAAFDQFNTSFQTGYRSRLAESHAHRLMGNASKHRWETIATFDAFCSDVTSLGRMLTDPAHLDALGRITASINAVTEQYTIIVHRRLGILAAKGGGNSGGNGDGEGNNGADGNDGNDGSDGNGNDGNEGGDDGFSNPDIENPPIPPYIPDFE